MTHWSQASVRPSSNGDSGTLQEDPTTEQCWRLTDDKEHVDTCDAVARDALVRMGWSLVAAISETGTITAQADEQYIDQGEYERDLFASLPEEEQRALRRQTGSVVLEQAGQSVPWKAES